MYEFNSPVAVRGVRVPYSYPYARKGIQGSDPLRDIKHVMRARVVNVNSLADFILDSQLSLKQILHKSDLLFRSIDADRMDFLKLFLSIPGWNFTQLNEQFGMSVAHYAATKPNRAFLFYILLASNNPGEFLNSRDPDGLTLLEKMQNSQHPLLPYLDSLVHVNYSKVWFAECMAGGANVERGEDLVSIYPLLKGFIDLEARTPAHPHFMGTAAEVTRFLLPQNNSLDLMCFGPESVGAETEFFHLVNQEKVNIIHFAQQRPFHNPFSEDKESAFIDFFIKSVRKLGAPPCAAGENDYKACVYGRNSTACVTLTNSPFSLDDYNPRAVTDTTQSICQYLNNNILIVSAGNYGRNTDDVVNLHTMDLGCTPEQLRHRLIATRFDYSGKKGELLFLDCHNYGPSVYAMAATAFQPGNCTEHPLCVSFGGYYGTSYAAPQILGVVMQIESVLRVNNVTYSADTVVDILNQGCVATTRPDLAKCLVDPPRVFEAAVKYAEKHKPTSGPKPIPEKLVPSSKKVVSRKKVPKNKKVSPKRVANSKGAMDSIGAGIYSGVINGMVRSAGNYVRQCSQQKGHDWMAAEAQAQVAMFTLLFTLRTVAEQQDAVSAATEALLFLTVQGMFYGCARVCRDLSEYTAGKGYKKLAKGLGIFAQVVEAVPMANTLLDPVEGVTGMIVGAVTERLCDHGLLTDKKQKRKSDPVSKIKRHVKKAR